VTIDRGAAASLTNLEVYADGVFVTRVAADGLLLSTPTGSTAYAASAGGALVHPSVDALLLTPVCPHALSFRPLLLPPTVTLRVVVAATARAPAAVAFDGRGRVALRPGDALTVAAAAHPLRTVEAVGGVADWLTALRGGLRWNEGRPLQKALEGGAGGGDACDPGGGGDLSDADSEAVFSMDVPSPAAARPVPPPLLPPPVSCGGVPASGKGPRVGPAPSPAALSELALF